MANLQTLSPARSGGRGQGEGDGSRSGSPAGSGVDLRSVDEKEFVAGRSHGMQAEAGCLRKGLEADPIG